MPKIAQDQGEFVAMSTIMVWACNSLTVGIYQTHVWLDRYPINICELYQLPVFGGWPFGLFWPVFMVWLIVCRRLDIWGGWCVRGRIGGSGTGIRSSFELGLLCLLLPRRYIQSILLYSVCNNDSDVIPMYIADTLRPIHIMWAIIKAFR